MSEYDDLGGWRSFKNGDWFYRLVARAFKNYWQSADEGYFRAKYPKASTEQLARRMISLACKNASALGVTTGVAMSTNEIVGLLTAAEGGVGLPANLAIGAASIGGEMIGVTHIQLKLLAQLGQLYGVPLDLDDPEDIWTIIAFAVGGSAAETAQVLGMRVGKHTTRKAVKSVFSKETLKVTQKLGRMIGVKILQKNIVKYSVPIVSVAIGGTWNYVSTRSMGRIAQKHFKMLVADQTNTEENFDGQTSDCDPNGTADDPAAEGTKGPDAEPAM